jgi:terminase, large subunit
MTRAADIGAVISRTMEAWRPPPRLSLSEWSEREFVLSSETAAEPGRFRALPYQREILDAITDPDVEMVSIMKSARVGFTICLSAAIGYYIAHDPSSILVVQPTVDDAKGFSKETIAPMLRDVPCLSRVVFADQEDRGKGPKDGSATLTHKTFPGGILSLVGANSGTGFRRVSRRIVLCDEVDAYPASAGSEGDPISLALKRSEAFHNRKAVLGSTPLVAGMSRIQEAFEAGDQRRYHVPCPHCGHRDVLMFAEASLRGHVMRWDEGKPETAHFQCRGCGGRIEHRHKREIIEAGAWVPDNPEAGGAHRSYHLWAAYSYSPNATWEQIARRFLAAKAAGPDKLRTFVNTDLGETWQERGEAPEWERLYQRRERYPIGTVPEGVMFLTSGVDVQRDRLVWEVTGWADDKRSWLVDIGIIWGDTAGDAPWTQLDELLSRHFPLSGGGAMPIASMAVDSGFQTQKVYAWCKRHQRPRVIAVKGVEHMRTIIGGASQVEVTVGGRRLSGGLRLFPVGTSVAKQELYGWLRLPADDDPPGFCHFPEVDESYLKELTAEHLIQGRNKQGFPVYTWVLLPGRENHYLDTRVYARAAASLLGLDKIRPKARADSAPNPMAPTPQPPPPAPLPYPAARAPAPPPRPRSPGGWLGGGGRDFARPGRGWLRRGP